MTEGTARDTILQKTLHVLVDKVGLTPVEVAQLRLSHLHLAGKNPNISFTPAEGQPPKTIELDLETHRALVGWLVARPDSKSDFLFPGNGETAMAGAEIEQALTAEPTSEPARASKPPVERPLTSPDETIASNSRPVSPPPARPIAPPAPSRPMPPVSRPEPPPSRPEMGPPLAGPAAAAAAFRSPPPPTAPPEVDKPVNIPLPTSAPKPPPPPAGMPEPEAEPAASEAVKGEPAPQPTVEGEEAGPVFAGAGDVKPGQPAISSTPPLAKAAGATQLQPKETATAGPLTAEQAAAQAVPRDEETSWLPRLVLSGSVVVIILTCVVCLGGGWLAAQSGPGQALLAGVGLGSESDVEPEETGATETGIEQPIFESPVTSPLATPTLPPTLTPTQLPTSTPAPPTETPTPFPTDTPAAPPTDTPVPTDTPAPTNTPALEEPAETATPQESEAAPAPAMKYGAPQLIEPEDGFGFISGNTIVLRWEPVGELAPDEQYAVRLVYMFENKPAFQGANIKDTEWLVPLSLFGQVDGPDNLYEWYVQVERLNDDGSGTAISPESERRTFTWR